MGTRCLTRNCESTKLVVCGYTVNDACDQTTGSTTEKSGFEHREVTRIVSSIAARPGAGILSAGRGRALGLAVGLIFYTAGIGGPRLLLESDPCHLVLSRSCVSMPHEAQEPFHIEALSSYVSTSSYDEPDTAQSSIL